MSSISRRHWVIALGLAAVVHAGLGVLWLTTTRQPVAPEQGNDGIMMDLTRIVDAIPQPEPEPEPKPEPQPEPDPEPKPQPRKKKPKPVVQPQPRVEAPAPVQAQRPPDPAPQVETTPRASAPSVGVQQVAPPPDYLGRLRSWLERHKVYPRSARVRGEEGTAVLALTIDRKGRIIKSSLAKSSGFPRLDQATLDIAGRASPVPPVPQSYPGDTIDIVMPVNYQLR